MRLGSSTLTYAEAPWSITGGFDTRIYGFRLEGAPDTLAGPLVLRLFRFDSDPSRARFEWAVQNAVAALGFPAPRALIVHPAADVLGGAFLVMERAPGRRMLDVGPGLLRLPALLARAHVRLHALDAEAVARAVEAAGFTRAQLSVSAAAVQLQREIGEARLDGLSPGADWLVAHLQEPPARVVLCHGDFHPLNVLTSGRQVSGVLDWANVRFADAAWDVGATMALFRHGPVDLPRFLDPIVCAVRERLLGAYLRTYLRERPLDPQALGFGEAFRTLHLLAEGGRHRLAAAGLIPPVSKPTAFGDPRTLAAVGVRFRALTGVAVSLPAV